MRVLVTGGAGGLGIGVCTLLTQRGHKVRILDLPTKRNLKSTKQISDDIEVFWGDITKPESIKKALDQIDMTVHMAAILPPLATQLPNLARNVNVGGTRNLIEAIKQLNTPIPIIYTSTVSIFGPTPDAIEPISIAKNTPNPTDSYTVTKYEAENIIKNSGLDFLILRLTATPYLTAEVKGFKQIFDIPLHNRVEFCHPNNIALAIGNAAKFFPSVKGKTLLISGGSSQRMLYKDMISGILSVMGLPLPPEEKFAKKPYYLDWFDTDEAESLLNFQQYTYADYLIDFAAQLSQQYSQPFVYLMKHFIGPVFGKLISRLM